MNLVKERVIDGNDFEKLITSGVYNLKKHIDIVNDLNVFPVPDGDTGDNMYLTINGGLNNLKNTNENAIGVKAEALANGMLLNARGNSGVILSQFFYGIALSLKDKINADTKVIAEAFKEGVNKAYASVVNPVEGTMLTVIREATENAINNLEKNESIGEFFDYYLNEMQSSLDRTPDLLFSLKEADVVDSGGKGLVYIVEGMKSAIEGKEIINNEENNTQINSIDFSKFNEDSIMEYGYCTEFLLQLQEQVAAEVIDHVYDIINTYQGKGNRWYDNDPMMLKGVELLRNAPANIQRIAALKLLTALEQKSFEGIQL